MRAVRRCWRHLALVDARPHNRRAIARQVQARLKEDLDAPARRCARRHSAACRSRTRPDRQRLRHGRRPVGRRRSRRHGRPRGRRRTSDDSHWTAGRVLFGNLSSGTYSIIVSLVGFGQASRNGVVVASSTVQVPPIELAVARLGETVVVSAARVETALVDAPATMSVIGTEVLTTTPAQNYGDLLRTLPGVNVVQLTARDVNVTSRQATSTLSTRSWCCSTAGPSTWTSSASSSGTSCRTT